MPKKEAQPNYSRKKFSTDDPRYIFADRLKKQMNKRHISQPKLAELTGANLSTVRDWCQHRSIPKDYIVEICKIFKPCTEAYFRGEIDEPNYDIKFVCELTGLSDSSIECIQNMATGERLALEALLSNPADFKRLLSIIYECMELPKQISESENRLENTARSRLGKVQEQAGWNHRATTYKTLSESDRVSFLRNEKSRLESLLLQQRPLRMEASDILVNLIKDKIAPHVNEPKELIADAESILSKNPELIPMAESEERSLFNDLERFGIHLKP